MTVIYLMANVCAFSFLCVKSRGNNLCNYNVGSPEEIIPSEI